MRTFYVNLFEIYLVLRTLCVSMDRRSTKYGFVHAAQAYSASLHFRRQPIVRTELKILDVDFQEQMDTVSGAKP